MVLFMPCGVRVFAKPMRYCSLARRTPSRLSGPKETTTSTLFVWRTNFNNGNKQQAIHIISDDGMKKELTKIISP